MKNRLARVNELLKEELSKLIVQEVDIERDILITITNIDTSPDLRYAKVLISVLPDSRAGSALKILSKSIYHLQKELDKRLSMRPVPKIRFEIDAGGKRYSAIEDIIKKIEKEERNDI